MGVDFIVIKRNSHTHVFECEDGALKALLSQHDVQEKLSKICNKGVFCVLKLKQTCNHEITHVTLIRKKHHFNPLTNILSDYAAHVYTSL